MLPYVFKIIKLHLKHVELDFSGYFLLKSLSSVITAILSLFIRFVRL